MVRAYSLLRCQAASGGSNSSAQEDQGEAGRSPKLGTWELGMGHRMSKGRHPRNELYR